MRLSWRVLRCGVTLGILAVILRYFILPQLRRAHLSLLAHLGTGWLVAGTLLAAASLLCYSLLTATLAVLGWRLVSYWLPIPAGGIAYASLNLLPGGIAAARDRAGRGPAAPGTIVGAGPAPIGASGE